jgi:cyanate lyase
VPSSVYDGSRGARAERCLAAKEAANLSFDELATTLGLTNAYTCQLLLGQAQLTPATAEKLKAALPGLDDADIKAMMRPPFRTFDDEILKEPNVYRTYEAIMHYGVAIKTLINEQCGDGIMSAIDFFMDVGTTTGKAGEKRVVITFNGKFLPHIEQVAENNTAPGPRADGIISPRARRSLIESGEVIPARTEPLAARVKRCLSAKRESKLSFDELADKLGCTNTYAAQLLLGQAQLKSATAERLKAVLPELSDDDISDMQQAPMRSFDDEILKEPNVYRTYEAIMHYGVAIKMLINEQCGDGIMSAIDFFMDVGTTTGKAGERRAVLTFNGKFLPHIEQVAANNTVPSPRA